MQGEVFTLGVIFVAAIMVARLLTRAVSRGNRSSAGRRRGAAWYGGGSDGGGSSDGGGGGC